MSTPERDPVTRLTALTSLLRGELDRHRAQAAARSVTERASGMLMERLSCTAAEARQQLERLTPSPTPGMTPACWSSPSADAVNAAGRGRRHECQAEAPR